MVLLPLPEEPTAVQDALGFQECLLLAQLPNDRLQGLFLVDRNLVLRLHFSFHFWSISDCRVNLTRYSALGNGAVFRPKLELHDAALPFLLEDIPVLLHFRLHLRLHL